MKTSSTKTKTPAKTTKLAARAFQTKAEQAPEIRARLKAEAHRRNTIKTTRDEVDAVLATLEKHATEEQIAWHRGEAKMVRDLASRGGVSAKQIVDRVRLERYAERLESIARLYELLAMRRVPKAGAC